MESENPRVQKQLMYLRSFVATDGKIAHTWIILPDDWDGKTEVDLLDDLRLPVADRKFRYWQTDARLHKSPRPGQIFEFAFSGEGAGETIHYSKKGIPPYCGLHPDAALRQRCEALCRDTECRLKSKTDGKLADSLKSLDEARGVYRSLRGGPRAQHLAMVVYHITN